MSTIPDQIRVGLWFFTILIAVVVFSPILIVGWLTFLLAKIICPKTTAAELEWWQFPAAPSGLRERRRP